MSALITASVGFEDGSAYMMARILGLPGAYIQQADITSIAFDVRRSDGSSVISGTLDKTAVIFDTLETTDSRWNDQKPAGDIGHNMAFNALATWFPDGGEVYTVEVLIVPATGATLQVPVHWKHSTVNRFSS